MEVTGNHKDNRSIKIVKSKASWVIIKKNECEEFEIVSVESLLITFAEREMKVNVLGRGKVEPMKLLFFLNGR